MVGLPAWINGLLGQLGDFESERRADKFWVCASEYNRLKIRIFLNPLRAVLNRNFRAKNAIVPLLLPTSPQIHHPDSLI
jgi:hypothetical protein